MVLWTLPLSFLEVGGDGVLWRGNIEGVGEWRSWCVLVGGGGENNMKRVAMFLRGRVSLWW